MRGQSALDGFDPNADGVAKQTNTTNPDREEQAERKEIRDDTKPKGHTFDEVRR